MLLNYLLLSFSSSGERLLHPSGRVQGGQGRFTNSAQLPHVQDVLLSIWRNAGEERSSDERLDVWVIIHLAGTNNEFQLCQDQKATHSCHHQRSQKYGYYILCSMQRYQRITSSCHHQRCKTSCYCVLKAELADRQVEGDLRRCLGELLRFGEGSVREGAKKGWR